MNDPVIFRSEVDKNVIENVQVFVREFSETLDTIMRSYNNGHAISLKEAEQIRKEWEDLKKVGETFVRACESGHYDS